jgi:hypothetical protein
MSDSPSPEQAAALGILTKARELLSDPERWTKGCAARTASPGKGLSGIHVDPTHASAACWCSIGALRRAAGHKNVDGTSYYGPATFPAYLSALRILGKAIEPGCEAHNATMVVAVTNDAENTKHADVLAMFDKAIALAKGTV